jgi:hypothetical protein
VNETKCAREQEGTHEPSPPKKPAVEKNGKIYCNILAKQRREEL